MKRDLKLPPRALGFMNTIVILFGGIYSLGGWICLILGTIFLWTLFLRVPEIDVFGLFIVPTFGLLGVVSIIKSFRMSLDTITLLKRGETTYGKLSKITSDQEKGEIAAQKFINFAQKNLDHKAKKKLKEKMSELRKAKEATAHPSGVLYYTFSFQTRQGESYNVEVHVQRKYSHLLEDEEEELIFYLPDNPYRAVVYDSVINAPEITRDGSFGKPHPSQYSVLIAPVIFALINVAGGWLYQEGGISDYGILDIIFG